MVRSIYLGTLNRIWVNGVPADVVWKLWIPIWRGSGPSLNIINSCTFHLQLFFFSAKVRWNSKIWLYKLLRDSSSGVRGGLMLAGRALLLLSLLSAVKIFPTIRVPKRIFWTVGLNQLIDSWTHSEPHQWQPKYRQMPSYRSLRTTTPRLNPLV